MGRPRIISIALSAAVLASGLLIAAPAWADNYVTITIDNPLTDGSDPINFTVDAPADATTECRVFRGNSTDWKTQIKPCLGDQQLDVSNYPSDDYRIVAISQDPDWEQTSANFTVDKQAPTIDLTTVGAYVLDRAWVKWHATNEVADTTDYESQIRWGDQNSGLGAWKPLDQTKVQREYINMPDGSTACIRVRGTDTLGHRSDWTDPTCMTRPLDDRNLSGWKGKNSDWKAINQTSLFEGTGLVAAATGSTLTLGKARVGTLVIWGRQGPYSGKLQIKLGTKVLDTVNLQAAASKRVVIYRHDFAKAKTGKITLTVTTLGKPVTLDAMAVSSL